MALQGRLAAVAAGVEWKRCDFRFVMYREPGRDRHDAWVLNWDPADDVESEQRVRGVVAEMPRRRRDGRVALTDGNSATLLRQDARGLKRGRYVECTVARSVDTDALVAFLVTEVPS